MISSAQIFDLGIKLTRILDHKCHQVDIFRIKYMLENETMDIIDYLEHDYGHIVSFDFFNKQTRHEITKIFQDRVLSIDFERKWGIQNDGIALLLAFTIELASFVMERDG